MLWTNLTKVTFSSLTLVGEYWKGGTTVNGTVEICPRNPPNLLVIGDEAVDEQRNFDNHAPPLAVDVVEAEILDARRAALGRSALREL